MGWWQRYLDWRHRNVQALELTAEGFRLRAWKSSVEVPWRSVSRVTAFKRDLMTTDLVCMMLELDDRLVEIHEGMIGYAALEKAMAKALNIGETWKLDVLFPAFAANPALIYERPAP
jgi:hypothetical protein